MAIHWTGTIPYASSGYVTTGDQLYISLMQQDSGANTCAVTKELLQGDITQISLGLAL